MKDYSSIASHIFIPHYQRKRPFDWNKEFHARRPIQVEIGFGHGEFLLRNALESVATVHVGLELDWGRIQKCFKKIAGLSEQQQRSLYQNLRILHVNAWDGLERIFKPRTIDHIDCLFPCPWPKERHERHRLFSHDFFKLANSRLKRAGGIQLVTDHWPYADWVTQQQEGGGFQFSRATIPARYETKFERKWVSGGQEHFCELIFKKKKHIKVPVKKDVDVKAYYHKEFFPEKFSLEKEVRDNMAVIPKEWVFDEAQQKGMVRLVVSESHLTQHIWVGIIKTRKGWCVLRSEGQQVLPTPGTARAIQMVFEAVQQTSLKS